MQLCRVTAGPEPKTALRYVGWWELCVDSHGPTVAGNWPCISYTAGQVRAAGRYRFLRILGSDPPVSAWDRIGLVARIQAFIVEDTFVGATGNGLEVDLLPCFRFQRPHSTKERGGTLSYPGTIEIQSQIQDFLRNTL